MKRTAYCGIKTRQIYKYVEYVNVLEQLNGLWAWKTYLEFGVIIHENGDNSDVGNKPKEVKKLVNNIIYA